MAPGRTRILLCGPVGCGKSLYVREHGTPQDTHVMDLRCFGMARVPGRLFVESNMSREYWARYIAGADDYFDQVVYWSAREAAPQIINKEDTVQWQWFWSNE